MSTKEELQQLVDEQLDFLEEYADVFCYHGDKPSSTDSENPDALFYGYSKDLHRDTLLSIMNLMINKFKPLVSKETANAMEKGIRENLHYTFDPSEYEACGGVKSIDIDLLTVPRKVYDQYHSLNQVIINLDPNTPNYIFQFEEESHS